MIDESPRASAEAAFAKVFGGEEPVEAAEVADAPEAVEPAEVEEAPSGPARGPDGKFVAKEAAPAPEVPEAPETPAEEAQPVVSDAPARFSSEAKAAWATTPPAVQAEIGRAFGELEKGLNEYRAKYEPIRAVAEMAEAQGQTLADVINHYTGIERLLAQDPLQGLDRICQNMGMSLRDVAAHVMGQPAPEVPQQVAQLSGRLREAEGELARYRAAERRQQEQAQSKAMETVSSFAAEAPRFAELEATIAGVLTSNLMRRTGDALADLKTAYGIAERLIPGSAPAPVAAPAATAATPPPAAHAPKKAGISIDGAPGSNPSVAPRSKTTREAVMRAAQAAGLA